LQSRTPNHFGNGLVLGEVGGETAHTLNISELPAHNHQPSGSSAAPSAASASGNLWATGSALVYASSPNASMNPAGILPTGGSQPHENMSPYLVLNFIIALQGIFPSQV
ncbi:MAG TPA: phage tail protein, partial [Candidatus Binatia bacterium]|nr:phage tail protein [Candidatus Binatia bacterium]